MVDSTDVLKLTLCRLIICRLPMIEWLHSSFLPFPFDIAAQSVLRNSGKQAKNYMISLIKFMGIYDLLFVTDKTALTYIFSKISFQFLLSFFVQKTLLHTSVSLSLNHL